MELGLRERKKAQTRQLIAERAVRLFTERGFEGVTVAEVARAADVAEKTVFNYFPTKEDLVYNRLETFESELLAAVRDRPAGKSVAAAFMRFVSRPRGLLARTDADERLRAVTAMIAGSPALVAREQLIFEQYTASLADLIAEESGAEVEAWIVANALIGAHRALLGYVRRGVLAGRSNQALARGVRAQAKRALALFEHGLGDFAVKPR
jgi:AcrR family transcriptional regulator